MIEPYYSDDAATLYLGDMRDVVPELRFTADVLITDPPYGVNLNSRRFGPIIGDDGSLDVQACIALALKRLREGRHVYVFGPNVLDGLPVGDVANLVWDKGNMPNPGNLSICWGSSHEPINFAVYRTSPANRAQGYGNGAARLRRGTVLRYQRPNSRGANRHATEKPVALMRELIESSSKQGELVLDPFAGSGATLVAATLAGRRSIGVEQDERYAETIAGRLADAHRIRLLADAA